MYSLIEADVWKLLLDTGNLLYAACLAHVLMNLLRAKHDTQITRRFFNFFFRNCEHAVDNFA